MSGFGAFTVLGILPQGLRVQGLVLMATVYLKGASRTRIGPDLRWTALDLPGLTCRAHLCYDLPFLWGCSSVGRAQRSQR